MATFSRLPCVDGMRTVDGRVSGDCGGRHWLARWHATSARSGDAQMPWFSRWPVFSTRKASSETRKRHSSSSLSPRCALHAGAGRVTGAGRRCRQRRRHARATHKARTRLPSETGPRRPAKARAARQAAETPSAPLRRPPSRRTDANMRAQARGVHHAAAVRRKGNAQRDQGRGGCARRDAMNGHF